MRASGGTAAQHSPPTDLANTPEPVPPVQPLDGLLFAGMIRKLLPGFALGT